MHDAVTAELKGHFKEQIGKVATGDIKRETLKEER